MDLNENNIIDEQALEKSTKKINKKIILVAVIFGILIIAGIVFLCGGLVKSNSEKLLELLVKENGVVDIVENLKENYNINGETNYNLTLKKDFLSEIDSTFKLLGNDLNLNTNAIKKENNIDIKTSLKLGTFELQKLEIVKENKNIALSVPNLFENFIVVNTENSEEIAKKLNFLNSGETLNSNEEIEKILKEYKKFLIKSLDKYIVINNNVELTLNEETLNTKEYVLELTEKELTEIEILMLEKLKNDDKTINIIASYEDGSYDTLKENIDKIYNELLESLENIKDETKLVALKINAFNNQNVKTTLKIDENIELIIYANSKNEEDSITVNMNINGTSIDINYIGTKEEENYKGLVNIKIAGENITAIELDIEKILDTQNTPRKISELNALVLEKASDEEIKKLIREIERNLGISSEEELQDTIYEEGEFVLDNPDEKIEILNKSVQAYNSLNLGMTRDEIIKIMGEPSASFEVGERENMGWYYNENNIYYISAELADGKVSKIYNDIVSDMEKNVQISEELGTQIEDITTYIEKINYNMTKDEVVNVLGDKYLEISKDEDGYKTYKWYDKRENILVIEFDSENNVSYVNAVTMDI